MTATGEYEASITYGGGMFPWEYRVSGPGLPKDVHQYASTLWGARWAVRRIIRKTQRVRRLGLDGRDVAERSA